MNKEEKIKKIIKAARALLGKKYSYGAPLAAAPELFDCSSFIQFVFKQVKTKLPRSTILQIECGKSISLDELQPGDLIFTRGSKFHKSKGWPNGVGHVALYVDNGEVIHAEGSKHNKVILEQLDQLLKSKDLRAVKRIL